METRYMVISTLHEICRPSKDQHGPIDSWPADTVTVFITAPRSNRPSLSIIYLLGRPAATGTLMLMWLRNAAASGQSSIGPRRQAFHCCSLKYVALNPAGD